MKSSYLCPYHLARLKKCEIDAMRNWTELMSRGLSAYGQCRLEAASCYLGAALEIALLRINVPQGSRFSDLHIIKPAQSLLEIAALDFRSDVALDILSRISAGIEGYSTSQTMTDFLAHNRARIGGIVPVSLNPTAGENQRGGALALH